mmetsp:Transcript_9825/g.17880  ORF Transcript_9825/g.17880 Transcript_9825/m.17880 type:complete len:107 (-) Transcript_9825:231-551(-)
MDGIFTSFVPSIKHYGYLSNHTLQRFCESIHEYGLPQDLRSLLVLNRDNSKSQAARLKMIHTHFTGDDIHVRPFIDMELEDAPHTIGWMAKDCTTNNDERNGDDGS